MDNYVVNSKIFFEDLLLQTIVVTPQFVVTLRDVVTPQLSKTMGTNPRDNYHEA